MNGRIEPAGLLEIDLAAVRHNYRVLAAQAGSAEVGCLVKANAYGLGMVPMTQTLAAAGCQQFFVATLEEGIAFREAFGELAVAVFEGARPGTEALFQSHALVPVLSTRSQLDNWRHAGGPCMLHIDTGMSRFGVDARDIDALLSEGFDFRALELQCIMTHLACADEAESGLNRRQLAEFRACIARLPSCPISIANSAGLFLPPEFHADLVRVGIAVCGGHPWAASAERLKTVVRLTGRVMQVRTMDGAHSVGYGATVMPAAGARLATIGVGYADGYPRSLSNRGMVAFAGQRLPVVGRISMDSFAVDVTAVAPDAIQEGDYVELIGDNIGIDWLAGRGDTISYELLTGLGSRLQRRYIGPEG